MTPELWITSGIAFAGLVLGITNYIWNVRLYSPRIKILTNYGITLQFPATYCIDIVNTSMIDIEIKGIYIGLEDEQEIFSDSLYISAGLPVKLKQGDSTSAPISTLDLAYALVKAGYSGDVKIRPICKDAIGNTHKCKWRKFSIQTVIEREEQRKEFVSK